MTDPEKAFAVAADAARGFDVLQCEPCARSVRNALIAAGFGGQLIELRGAAGRDFMICLGYDGGLSTITQNGRHVGVRVGDTVFDNLHPHGLPFDTWLADFDAIGGVRVHAVIDF
jgi:hypothetical protein